MNTLLRLNFGAWNTDLGLLIFRIGFSVNLFVNHGLFKFPLLVSENPSFPDPFSLGVRFTIAFALLSDGICTVLVAFGLGTRFAAMFMTISLAAGWGSVHGFSIIRDNGEFMALYLAGAIMLLLTGPGRYSLDYKLVARSA